MAGHAWVFTDGHADMAISRFFTDLSELAQIDWAIMRETYWHDTRDDGDRKRRRQAEFLAYGFLPWSLITEIGVMTARMAQDVKAILRTSAHQPEVVVRREWYY